MPPVILEWLDGAVPVSMDKLDGRLAQEFTDTQACAAPGAGWSGVQDPRDQKAGLASVDQAIDMVRLTSRASGMLLKQPASADSLVRAFRNFAPLGPGKLTNVNRRENGGGGVRACVGNGFRAGRISELRPICRYSRTLGKLSRL